MLWVRDFSHCCSRLSCLRGLRASGYSLVLARFSAFLRRLAIISMPRFGICAEERRKFLERAELSSLLRLQNLSLNYLREMMICWWRLAISFSARSSEAAQLSDPPSEQCSSLLCCSSCLISSIIDCTFSLSRDCCSDLPPKRSFSICQKLGTFSSLTSLLRSSWCLDLALGLISGSRLVLACSFLRYFFLPCTSSSLSICQYSAMLSAMVLPTNSHFCGVKGTSMRQEVEQQLPILAQTVQQWGICFRMTALAVVLFQSEMRKRQLQYRNISVLLAMILGSILVRQQLCSQMSYSGPQMNTFLRTECPWKSRKKSRRDLNSAFRLFTRFFTAFTSGMSRVSSAVNMRLRSLPLKLVRQLPSTTPSTLIMGTTLKMLFLRRYLASSSSEQRNSSSPFTMKLPQVSPGWMRPHTSTTFFASLTTSGSVIVSSCNQRPPSDSASTSSLSILPSCWLRACSWREATILRLSAQVKGGQQANWTCQSASKWYSKVRQLKVRACCEKLSSSHSQRSCLVSYLTFSAPCRQPALGLLEESRQGRRVCEQSVLYLRKLAM